MKRITAIILTVCLLLSFSAYAENAAAALQDLYAQAELAMAMGDYAGAGAKFEALGAYSDASQMAMYCKAIAVAETFGMYDMAVSAFAGLGDFKDSKQMALYYKARGYQAAGDSVDIAIASDDDLASAKFSYNQGAETYAGLALFKDCLTRMSECQTKSKAIEAEQKTRAAAKLEAAYQAALALEERGEYQKAIDAFTAIKAYKDSREHIAACEKAILEEKLEAKYQKALILEDSGDYYSAFDIFMEIPDYRDVAYRLENDKNLKLIVALKSIGNIITFGNYEQDDNTLNGKEPVEWIILNEKNGNILLISRYGLEKKAFHDVKLTIISWANCALRKYLNDDFFYTAFSAKEQAAIILSDIDNSSKQWYKEWIKDYPNWETQGEGGKATQDRVFLLSYAEANQYFGVTIDNKNNAKGRMVLTLSAIAQGAANKSIDNEITGIWWLRTPGQGSPFRASAVNYDGSLCFSDIGSDYAVIRPAICVNLNALIAIYRDD